MINLIIIDYMNLATIFHTATFYRKQSTTIIQLQLGYQTTKSTYKFQAIIIIILIPRAKLHFRPPLCKLPIAHTHENQRFSWDTFTVTVSFCVTRRALQKFPFFFVRTLRNTVHTLLAHVRVQGSRRVLHPFRRDWECCCLNHFI